MTDAPYLVFGGTGGIGAALARRLAAAGRRVHLAARDETRLGALAAEIGATWSRADAFEPASLDAAVAAADPAGTGIAGLAWCVGSIVLKPLGRLGEADFLDAFRLNALGPALAVRAAQASLVKAGGAVVLFSSVAARQGFPMHAAIGTAKAAVEGLTLSLAAELAPSVRVNCVAPSLTRTPLAAGLLANPAMDKAMAAMHPLARLGEADDVAALAAFLIGPDSGWITGQIVGVDGGRAALRVKA